MKILTIFGTRPEIIRLSLIIKLLDGHCEHLAVHTGQNFHPLLSDVFFEQLGLRRPDIELGIESPDFGEQAGLIISKTDALLRKHRPDRLLILGDTNSGLAAIPAARLGIPVFHLEAGNRCFDDRVPEEINRRIIDHCSTILMPYTGRSRGNLLAEGIDRNRIFVTGNPIFEVLQRFAGDIESCDVLRNLGLKPRDYFLVTAHRSENVDDPVRLRMIFEALERAAAEYSRPVLVSLHPRTAEKISTFGIECSKDKIRLLDPFGFFEFVNLEKNAFAVLSDSGTVQEECSILRVPNITIRDVTERPETIECGSNILSGVDPDSVLRAIKIAVSRPPAWSPPPEYLVPNVAETVCRILLGHIEIPR